MTKNTDTVFRPLHGNVICRIIPQGETEGGIVIPETATENPSGVVKAKVLAVGPGRLTDAGGRMEMSVKDGDVVIFQQNRTVNLKIGHDETGRDGAIIVIGDFDILVQA